MGPGFITEEEKKRDKSEREDALVNNPSYEKLVLI